MHIKVFCLIKKCCEVKKHQNGSILSRENSSWFYNFSQKSLFSILGFVCIINVIFSKFSVITNSAYNHILLPQTVINRLKLLQNQALRLITGAVKFTPISAMLLLTGNISFLDILKMKALLLYEKLLRTEDSYWRDYVNKPRYFKNSIWIYSKNPGH